MEREMWGGVLLPWNIFLPFDRTSTKKRMVHINSKIPCSRRLKINWQRRRRGLDAYQRRRRSTRCWSSGRVPICTWWCAWARSGTRSGTDYASTLPWSTARPSIGSWNGRGKPSSKLATSSSWISIWRSLSPAKLNRLVLGAQPLLLFPSFRPIDPIRFLFLWNRTRDTRVTRESKGRGEKRGGEPHPRPLYFVESDYFPLDGSPSPPPPPSGELPSGMQSSKSVSGDQALNIFEFATITYRASTLKEYW